MTDISIGGQQAKESLQWVGWADNEYIAARQLLLSNFLIQGSGLSNTTIEKYLKALFALLGLKIPRGFKGHNIYDLYNKINAQGINLPINKKYLALLFKSYKLRYPDDLEPGYNIALNRTKLLIELDHTVYKIRKGFDFHNSNKKVVTIMEGFNEENKSILLNKNCFFGSYNRQDLFKENCFCYELRVLNNGEILEASYCTTRINDDDKFEEEGLKPADTGYQLKNEHII